MTKSERLEFFRNQIVEILIEKNKTKTQIALPYLHYELNKQANEKIDIKKYGYDKFSIFVSNKPINNQVKYPKLKCILMKEQCMLN